MTECIFCSEQISDMGLGWYEHVDAEPVCDALWDNWMERIKADHPEG